MEPWSMLEKLILYFVYQTKGHITKTQLVKFLYLADLYTVKWTGRQLTDLDWYYYNYGPWHEEIDAALGRLQNRVIPIQSGGATLLTMAEDRPDLSSLEIPQSLHFMLDNIRREWVGGSTAETSKVDKLLEYVYSTAPMLAIKQNKHEPSEKVPLNLALERELLVEELGV